MTNNETKALTGQTRPYWQPVLDQAGKSTAPFTVKLCYHTEDYDPAQMIANCFPGELDREFYFELLDMGLNPLDPGFRKLHRLPLVADRKSRYKHFPNAYGGWYSVPLSEFEVVNVQDLNAPPVPTFQIRPEPTPVPAPQPVMAINPTYALPAAEEEFHYQDDEQFDFHQKDATIRDLYAVTHSVPCSNKAELNRMIREGNQLRIEQAQLERAA